MSFNVRGAKNENFKSPIPFVFASGSPIEIMGSTYGADSSSDGASFVFTFYGYELKTGNYELKDLQSATVMVMKPGTFTPEWLCNLKAGETPIGAARIKIESLEPDCNDTRGKCYTVHGVFEALLLPADDPNLGNLIFHGEF